MIVSNLKLQCLECDRCGEQVEIKRKVLRDPEQMLNMLEDMRDKHQDCAPLETSPVETDRERAERIYREGMKTEMAKATANSEPKRCRTKRK